MHYIIIFYRPDSEKVAHDLEEAESIKGCFEQGMGSNEWIVTIEEAKWLDRHCPDCNK